MSAFILDYIAGNSLHIILYYNYITLVMQFHTKQNVFF